MSSPDDSDGQSASLSPPTGRFAPSPSAQLHIGNLRTALVAWLSARSADGRFLLRIEDLDRSRSREAIAIAQLEDLAALGLDWDAEPLHQSKRGGAYADALRVLEEAGMTYPCWCTRGELAAVAPHGATQRYPGTCRNLSKAEVIDRKRSGRQPAIRARLHEASISWLDGGLGQMSGEADDPIIVRSDGDFAYNLAVVVDDGAQGVTEVVRGADLADSVATQAALCDALGVSRPTWTHVPLVVGADGQRLAKRHGAVTLADWKASGGSENALVILMAESLGLCENGDDPSLEELLRTFTRSAITKEPWVWEGKPQL